MLDNLKTREIDVHKLKLYIFMRTIWRNREEPPDRDTLNHFLRAKDLKVWKRLLKNLDWYQEYIKDLGQEGRKVRAPLDPIRKIWPEYTSYYDCLVYLLALDHQGPNLTWRFQGKHDIYNYDYRALINRIAFWRKLGLIERLTTPDWRYRGYIYRWCDVKKGKREGLTYHSYEKQAQTPSEPPNQTTS